MTHLRTGIDLIEIERFREAVQRHGMRFLKRVFTSRELQEVGENIPSLAARFAAKEAAAKALGTGIGAVRWQEIEVLRGPARQPGSFSMQRQDRLAEALELEEWSLSLSHSREHAIALIVALGD